MLRRIWRRIAIAVAFYPPLAIALSGAFSCYYALGQTGIMAAGARWAGMVGALYAVSSAAYKASSIFSTGNLPRIG